MHHLKTSLIPLFIFLFAGNLSAQESELGNWFQYFGSKKLNQKWNWHNEVQYRNYNFIGDLEQLLLRTGVGYNLTENNNNLLLGYGFIRAENYQQDGSKAVVNEHRTFLQFITKQLINNTILQHRYRFEQRWIEGDFKLRLRYFIGVNIPLKKSPISSGDYYLSIYNEIFLNTENSVFDRNRLYGAVGYKVNNKFRVELGYMNQFFEAVGRDQINIGTFFTF